MDFEKAGSGPLYSKIRPLFRFNRKERAFIIPTGFGLAFGAMAFVLLFMAIGYANNLIYIYVFGLISMALTSMYVTNKNVEMIRLLAVDGADLFAGEEGELMVIVENSTAQDAHLIKLWSGKKDHVTEVAKLPHHRQQSFAVKWKPLARGRIQVPAVTLESRYPFDILRAWKVLKSKNQVLVYPEKKGNPLFPESAQSGRNQGQLGLFRDLRGYQSTDSPKRIDWKASAKFQELLVKNFEGEDSIGLHLTWEQTSHLSSFEDRLSQLSLWVCEAHRINIPFSFEAPGWSAGLSQGLSHFRNCMEYLALLTEDEL